MASSRSVRSAILRLPEFASLLKTGKRDGTSNLIPELTQLYDCPPVVEHKTRQHPVEWKEPFLNIATGTTKKWLADSLTESLIIGGFGNRFVYPFGTMKEPDATPPPIDRQALTTLVQQINSMRNWVKELKDQRELTIDSDAEKLFAEWYTLFALQANGEGIIPSLAVRLQGVAWKLALLYAVWGRSSVITRAHLEPALAVVDWQRESNRAIFSDFLGSNKEIEGRIVSRLERAEGRTRLDREMYKSLHISGGRLATIYKGLEDVGVVRATEFEGKKGEVSEKLGIPIGTSRNWYRDLKKKGLLSQQQPVGHISLEEFRQWVSSNLDGLAQVIEVLKNELPLAQPAFTPWNVFSASLSVSSHRNLSLPLLQQQLYSYTRRNPVWSRIRDYQRHVSKLRPYLDRLQELVQQNVKGVFEIIEQERNLKIASGVKENFADLLFYHAVAVALGQEGFSAENRNWQEERTATGDVLLKRGHTSALGSVPLTAKDKVKKEFESLMGTVAELDLVHKLKPEFTLRQRERGEIAAALDSPLVA